MSFLFIRNGPEKRVTEPNQILMRYHCKGRTLPTVGCPTIIVSAFSSNLFPRDIKMDIWKSGERASSSVLKNSLGDTGISLSNIFSFRWYQKTEKIVGHLAISERACV